MGDIILNGIKYAGRGGGASSLSQLTDVNVTSPSDGQFLTYDGHVSKCERYSRVVARIPEESEVNAE